MQYTDQEIELIRAHGFNPPKMQIDTGYLSCAELQEILQQCSYSCTVIDLQESAQVVTYHINRNSDESLSQSKRKNAMIALQEELHMLDSIQINASDRAHFSILIPRKDRQYINLDTIISHKENPFEMVLGVDTNGNTVTIDITNPKTPHILVAGCTGGGKSVLLHSMIKSLQHNNDPKLLRFYMVDPKTELSIYENCPFTDCVLNSPSDAINMLKDVCMEIEKRKDLLRIIRQKSIEGIHNDFKHLFPRIVIVIDEYSRLVKKDADAKKALDRYVEAITEEGRALGIHIIAATQHPDAQTISGPIKANIPVRIALRVATSVAATRILETPGADKLIGNGDALIGNRRFQSAYVEGV